MLSRLLPRLSLLACFGGLLALIVAGPARAPAVPWPGGAQPAASALDEAVASALRVADRELTEEMLDAFENGEDREEIEVAQSDIDRRALGHEGLFRHGDALFSHEFRDLDGYGDGTFTTLRRVHTATRGGADTFSCAGCHSVGGPDGAGSETQNALVGGDGEHASSANVRNAPAMLGLGLVQALAAEMSTELVAERDRAVEAAVSSHRPVTATLASKGVSFGSLVAQADGQVDASGVEGVSADLVVRPFGWKGGVARLRRFVEEAARIHFGVQSDVLALGYKAHPDVPHLGPGPRWFDPDNDGVLHELQEGALTAGAVYLAMLEVPVVLPPVDAELHERWARGSALFDAVGCAGCHARTLHLDDPTWREVSDTTGTAVVLNLLDDGDDPRGAADVPLFSDLRRHAMGPGLADPHDEPDGVARGTFLTRPLWGLAETAPYLHDGRAATLPAAILAHGGEAQASRDAFAALAPDARADLHVFLLSLTREPKPRVAR